MNSKSRRKSLTAPFGVERDCNIIVFLSIKFGCPVMLGRRVIDDAIVRGKAAFRVSKLGDGVSSFD